MAVLKATRAFETWKRAYTALRNFFAWCPVKRVSKLTPELAERYAGIRKEQGAAIRTVNIEIGAVKTSLNWAVDNSLILRNPLQRVKKLRGESQGRLRFLDEKEMHRLLQAANGTVYHDIFFAFLKTGMRKGELIHLRWNDVDSERGLIRVGGHRDQAGTDSTKTYRERHLPMDKELAGIIARQPRRPDCPYVFGTERGTARKNNLNRQLKTIAKKAGIEDVNLHTLRHSFASHLVMHGVDLASIKELLGHSTIQMTMRYAHLAKKHLRAAMETMAVPSFQGGPNVAAGPGFKRAATK